MMCHALIDTWLGETGTRGPVIASVATLELAVADVSVDKCVFERSCCRATRAHRELPVGGRELPPIGASRFVPSLSRSSHYLEARSALAK